MPSTSVLEAPAVLVLSQRVTSMAVVSVSLLWVRRARAVLRFKVGYDKWRSKKWGSQLVRKRYENTRYVIWIITDGL
jgi:hypothetical protein